MSDESAVDRIEKSAANRRVITGEQERRLISESNVNDGDAF